MDQEKDDFRLKLDPALKKELGKLFEKRGIDRTKASTRIMGWFLRQDEVIQQHILEQLPGEMESAIARLVLEKMAKEAHHPNNVSSGSVVRG